MSRWKASAIHFGISVFVVLTIAAAMASTWYPPLLTWAGGRLGIFAILFCVDVSVGPLLTLLVFKTGKPSLKFDLSVIAVLQVLGLSYGLHILYEARPVYIVFAVDTFHLVNAPDIPEESQDKARLDEFKSLPLTGPKIIAANLPKDADEKMAIVFKAISGGADIQQLPQYYVSYREVAQQVLVKAMPLKKLADRDAATQAELRTWLDKNQRDEASVKWLPLVTRPHELTVLVDGGTADVLDILSVQPL